MQEILALLVLMAALSYLGWQFYARFIQKNAKCDSCAFGNSSQLEKKEIS